MQVEFKIVDYNDNNSCHFFSFNYEIKNYEAKESLVFFKVVQNAFAQATLDYMGSKG